MPHRHGSRFASASRQLGTVTAIRSAAAFLRRRDDEDDTFAVESSDSRGVSLLHYFPCRMIMGTVPKSPFHTCCSGLKRIVHENSRR
ncbi:hypothetical protein BS78_07G172400 [Paspalum vaginatum]|nr:hypothetical protein BS78_07G172400 [Paspalum vaginatum]